MALARGDASARGTQRRTAVAAVVGAAYAIVVAWNLVILLNPPHLFAVVRMPPGGPTRLAWVQPGSMLWDARARAGDRVRTDNGRALIVDGDVAVWMGRRLTVVPAERTGGTPIRVDAAAISARHPTWPLLILGPCFLLLGTLVYLRAARADIARATYALFTGAAVALALAPGADSDNPPLTAAEFAAVTAFGPLLVRFCLTFPVARATPRLRQLLGVATAATVAVYLAALAAPALFGLAALARAVLLLGGGLLGLGLLAHAAATGVGRDAAGRRGIAILGAGAVLGLLPFLALSLAPTLLGRPPLVAPEVGILALALLPASFAYAILRHNIVDVRLAQRWLVYGLPAAVLLAAYTALALAVRAVPLAAVPDGARGALLSGAAVAAVGLSFAPAWAAARRIADRRIFKDTYDYRASLQDLSRELSLVGDLPALSGTVCETLRRLMNLDFAVLLAPDKVDTGDGGDGDMIAWGDAGVYRPEMLPELAAAVDGLDGAPRVVPLAFGYLRVLVAPLGTPAGPVGYLCLGPKASGEPFRPTDLDLLATLSGHLGAAVRNAQLVEDLRGTVWALEAQRATLDTLNARLERGQEEERARLAADIHDEPLQTALHLQRTLAAAPTEVPAAWREEALALGQRVVDELRAVCATMRPAVLDDLGLRDALDLLAEEMGERSGVPIFVDVDDEVAGAVLAPDAEIALYRAAQEALNNGLRHARPRAIRLTLEGGTATGVARLRVVDDGVGFAVPARLDAFARDGHLGLAGLRERVRHAGGTLAVSSAPGGGTVVDVAVPLPGSMSRGGEEREKERAAS